MGRPPKQVTIDEPVPHNVLRLEGRFEPSWDGWWFTEQGRPFVHLLQEKFGTLDGRFIVTVERVGG